MVINFSELLPNPGIVALPGRNMDIHKEIEVLRSALHKAENIQTELDRRVFHLKTLYDVSADIFSSVESETILRNCLLMTMGNFGVMGGFILTMDVDSKETGQFVSVGLHDSDDESLRNNGKELLLAENLPASVQDSAVLIQAESLPPGVECALPFTLESDCIGLLALGAKLVGEPYSEDDRELLVTLVNNLVVSLKNARSFEEIKRLNEHLQAQNLELEKALRKVEILESVKANLSKFVPTTVSRLIEKSPTASIPESKEQDVSVLFVDIEGYTKICEQLGNEELNEVVEKYFSVFMDAIYANNGDVNETAGDGLMVLFHSEDQVTNALEAVRTALTIKEEASSIKEESGVLSEPLVINMGINSGLALLGAAKFESYTGSRWTYTARGLTTNVAARIGSLATGGSVLLSKYTADRVKDQFSLTPLGKFKLKNVSEEMEVFSV